MNEHDNEPVRGLPGRLPAGEWIVWQGSPAWAPLARRAFHTHLVAGYFAVLIGWAGLNVATGHRTLAAALPGIGLTAAVGVGAVGLLALLGWLAARATVYTITNRRVVLRFGIALTKCINLPFSRIAAAGLAVHADGSGDVPLSVSEHRVGFFHLWPHVRPWHLTAPQPMLRGLAEPAHVAQLLGDALLAAMPGRHGVASTAAVEPERAPTFVPGSLAA